MALPLSGLGFILSFEVEGRPPVPPAQQPAMQVRVATPGYFSTIGIPLKRGRGFTDDDRAGTPRVVLITESAARQYFPGEDPIGKTIKLGWGRGPGKPRAGGVVVGIVGDMKDAGLDEADPPQIYLPYRPVARAVHERGDEDGGAARDARRGGKREVVYAVDPNLPVSNVGTLEQIVAQFDFAAAVLHDAAGGRSPVVALVLAAIGIFGVLSYAVVAADARDRDPHGARRAGPQPCVGLVVRQAMMLCVAGVMTGTVSLALFAVADDGEDALQREADRSVTTFAASPRPARRGRAVRELPARETRDAGGPDRRAQERVEVAFTGSGVLRVCLPPSFRLASCRVTPPAVRAYRLKAEARASRL